MKEPTEIGPAQGAEANFTNAVLGVLHDQYRAVEEDLLGLGLLARFGFAGLAETDPWATTIFIDELGRVGRVRSGSQNNRVLEARYRRISTQAKKFGTMPATVFRRLVRRRGASKFTRKLKMAPDRLELGTKIGNSWNMGSVKISNDHSKSPDITNNFENADVAS